MTPKQYSKIKKDMNLYFKYKMNNDVIKITYIKELENFTIKKYIENNNNGNNQPIQFQYDITKYVDSTKSFVVKRQKDYILNLYFSFYGLSSHTEVLNLFAEQAILLFKINEQCKYESDEIIVCLYSPEDTFNYHRYRTKIIIKNGQVILLIIKKFVGKTVQPNHDDEYDFLYGLEKNPSRYTNIGYTCCNNISHEKYNYIAFDKNIKKFSRDSFGLYAFNLLFCNLHKT